MIVASEIVAWNPIVIIKEIYVHEENIAQAEALKLTFRYRFSLFRSLSGARKPDLHFAELQRKERSGKKQKSE